MYLFNELLNQSRSTVLFDWLGSAHLILPAQLFAFLRVLRFEVTLFPN